MTDPVTETIAVYDATDEKVFSWYFNNKGVIRARRHFLNYVNMNTPKTLPNDHYNDRRILDAGCGSGRDTKFFFEHKFGVAGIDLSVNSLQYAREHVPYVGKEYFMKMDLRKMFFYSQTFAGVWAAASFLHVPKSEAVDTLEGFRKVLIPKGTLFVSVRKGKGEELKPSRIPGKSILYVSYEKDELVKLAKKAGLSILEATTEDIWLNLFAQRPA